MAVAVADGGYIYTSTPIMIGDFDYSGLTYNGAVSLCKDKGKRVCLSSEICDMSSRTVTNPELTSYFPYDNWIAVGDKQDEWLTLNAGGGRYCKTHTEVAGDIPNWSNDNSYSPGSFVRLVKCCFLRPSQQPSQPLSQPSQQPSQQPSSQPSSLTMKGTYYTWVQASAPNARWWGIASDNTGQYLAATASSGYIYTSTSG